MSPGPKPHHLRQGRHPKELPGSRIKELEPNPWTEERLTAAIEALPFVRPEDRWVGLNRAAYRAFLKSKPRNYEVSEKTLDRRGRGFSRVKTHDRPPRIFWFDRPLPNGIHDAISRVRLGGKSVPDSTIFVLRDADVFEDGKPRTLVTLWQVDGRSAFFVSWVLEGKDLATIPNP